MVIELRHNEDLDQLLERSGTDPVLIFKHSTQCSISIDVYEEFLRFTEAAPDAACGVVLVIENRALSDNIAAKLGVRHESPQAIVVQNGRQTWHAAHWSVTADALVKAMTTPALRATPPSKGGD